ncbi:DUF1684 domain-containing protein [Nocardia farcinica]|uniref:DUF1684 domain-containing protein n=2 Tax=Nocardia farcinica TaxID=37329 RepID=Q5YZ03_NOCFA|nr:MULTISPECIES: DUF1684 domain-containing protein [Nocardia]AXK85636.1 DUF1684 domain-containing protein [Nocardia farcinica]MBA4859550.1 DUF1684 domain-containing protein [Nocardia farcinica]MBC9817643.1 DUF1684 domain-containing protein [Nocardia farcinica]MBF6071556.1 DUF1684 domain-containing protein [Nocardia farcinica]MBF6142658.1 DUF1684 domain-containing protein [Nocardia farcinica]
MTTSTATGFETDWAHWHRAREDQLRDPLGFLSLTALHWLSDRPEHFDGLPGTWWVTDDKVFITAQPGDRLIAEGSDIAGVRILTPVEGGPGVPVRHERRILEVIRRTGRHAVRVHDPAAPALARFTGVPAYAPDPRWVLPGRFTAFAAPRTVTTGAVIDGLEHQHQAVGVVEFAVGAVTEQVVVFRTGADLRILFTDATSGVTTYPAARSLTLPAPDAEGAVVLDFNRAVNLPCAFTDFATCPVAPEQNRLRVAIEAGEQDPRLGGAPR